LRSRFDLSFFARQMVRNRSILPRCRTS